MNFNYNAPFISQINIPQIKFRASAPVYIADPNFKQDTYVTNPLYDRFSDRQAIESAVRSNPVIMNILKENNLPLKINVDEYENLKHGHLMDTRIVVAKMYSALPDSLKKEINLQDLQDAARLHDLGKMLIPEKILNKKDALTEEEKQIIELHSLFGAEILKSMGGFNSNVINMVKYHHQTNAGNGYPVADSDYSPDLAQQILHIADKYTALKEKRSYKEEMSDAEALEIIRQDVESGLISPEVYEILMKAV